MLIQQYLLHRLCGRQNAQGFGRQPDEVFQHNRVVYRLSHCFSPGERPMIRHQGGGTCHRISLRERFHNNPSRTELVIILNLL